MYYFINYPSPIGMYTIVCDDEKKNIVGVWIKGQKYYATTVDEMVKDDNIEVLNMTKNWLDRYFAGEKPSISELPLTPTGTDFRQEVWKILCEIPYGEVITYGEIAKKMAKKLNKEKMSGQAVGGAVGHTPISIIIP